MTTAKPATTDASALEGRPTVRPQFTWSPYANPRRNPANWLSVFGFASGVAAIGFAQHRLPLVVLACMGFSTVMDLADGTVARMTGTVNLPYPIGHQLDFAADLAWAVGGGAAMIYYGQLYKLHAIGAIICVVWCVCGMARLARYTVMGHSDDGYFIGCPAPMAANIMIFVVMMDVYVVRFSAIITAVLAVVLSGAMVSWFQLPSWATFGTKISDHVVAWELGRKVNGLISATLRGPGQS